MIAFKPWVIILFVLTYFILTIFNIYLDYRKKSKDIFKNIIFDTIGTFAIVFIMFIFFLCIADISSWKTFKIPQPYTIESYTSLSFIEDNYYVIQDDNYYTIQWQEDLIAEKPILRKFQIEKTIIIPDKEVTQAVLYQTKNIVEQKQVCEESFLVEGKIKEQILTEEEINVLVIPYGSIKVIE